MALEPANDGQGGGHRAVERSGDLEGPWPEAASGGDLQTVERSALRREARGHGWPVSQPAGARHRAVGRREVPDPGARPHPTGLADEEGSGRNHDPRLQAPRHHHLVRSARRARRPGDRPMYAKAPSSGIHPLSQQDQPGRHAKPRGPPDCRQLRHAQAFQGQGVAGPPSTLPHAFHADIGVLAQSGRALVFAEITRKRIRRGVFHSIADLQMAINDYLDQHNADPIPFVWTASAASIIKKVNRGKQVLESQH